jgi:hypothetical protein
VLPAWASEADDVVAGLSDESVLAGPGQPVMPGGDEGPPVAVDPDGDGVSAWQPPWFAMVDGTVAVGALVGDGALDDVLTGDGALVGVDSVLVGDPALGVVLAEGGALDVVLAGGGAAVVGTGVGVAVELLRTMFELPLLWYPSVARIM